MKNGIGSVNGHSHLPGKRHGSPGSGQRRGGQLHGRAVMPPFDPKTGEYLAGIERRSAEFQRKLPKLLKQYRDEFVAISGDKVVGHDLDLEKLSQKVRRKFKPAEIYIRQVLPKPHDVVHIDSIEI